MTMQVHNTHNRLIPSRFWMLVLLFCSGAASSALHGLEAEFTIAVDKPQLHARKENVQILAKGPRDKPELVLQDQEYRFAGTTDLLLGFNDRYELENGGYYLQGEADWTIQNQRVRLGKGAAQFLGSKNGTELKAHPGALFSPGTFPGSFSLEFWQNAPTIGEGQNIINWAGSAWLGKQLLPQVFSVGFKNRHLVWSFSNFFLDLSPEGQNTTVQSRTFTLENRRELVPNTWYHHLLRYDAKRGLLEYLVNGTTEAVTYTTSNGREGGQRFSPYIGERSNNTLILGAGYKGFLDELRLDKTFITEPRLNGKTDSGYVIFSPLEFKTIGAGSKILKFLADYRKPGNSDIHFSYFMVDSTFPPAFLDRADKNWIKFTPGQEIKTKNTGLWLLLKVEFFPDGSGESRPGLQGIKIVYTPDPPPPAPGGLVAIPADGRVTLTWNKVPSPDIQGYVLYYGTKPGQYFGTGSPQGTSPIRIPAELLQTDNTSRTASFTLEGLENYRSYYFAVASFDRSNDPSIGLELKRSLSREVSARPAP